MTDSIQALVRADLEEREKLGTARYGTALHAHNGRDALLDAYEEALDMACYLKQAQIEIREHGGAGREQYGLSLAVEREKVKLLTAAIKEAGAMIVAVKAQQLKAEAEHLDIGVFARWFANPVVAEALRESKL